MKNFNYAPYYDDFDENKKFYRILFRPGYAVQARELTQLQTQLQNQIQRHGDAIFKDGAMIIPGQISVDTTVSYVKIKSTNPTDLDVTKLDGDAVTNISIADDEIGLGGQIVKAIAAEGEDPATIYIRYTNSSDDTTVKEFTTNTTLNTTLVIGSTTATVDTADTAAVGLGSIASIQRGVYYVGGNFVLCEEQTIVLDKYSNTPSYRVGLYVTETVKTPEQDSSLLDNAQGSSNYAAPGAHRYYIDLTLTKLPLDSEDDANFIELARVADGKLQRIVNKTAYSELEKTMARRTFDESGNYTLRPFTIGVREHRNNNRGEWAASTDYLIGDVVTSSGHTYVSKRNETSGSIAPVHTANTAYDGPGNTGVQWEYNTSPFYNRGVYDATDGGDSTKLAIGLEPGKAYVQGYEIEKIATEYVPVDKSRAEVQIDNAIIPATVGNYMLITNMNSMPPVDSFAKINLYDRLTSSVGVAPSGGTVVGTARVRFVEWDNGDRSTQAAIYKLGLFDITMNGTYDFDRDVKSVFYAVGGDANLSFSANISPILTRLIGSATASSSTTITGNGTSFQTDLSAGDYISLGGTVRRVVSISSQVEMVVDQSTTVTGVTIDRLSTEVREPDNLSLIYQLPYYAIKSVRSATSSNDTTYTVYERFTGTSGSAGGGSTCTLILTTASGSFASSADNDNYILVDNNATTGGAVVVVDADKIVPSGSNLTITLPSTHQNKSFIVVAAINKSGSLLTEKTKTLKLAGETGTVITKTTQATATTKEILLGKADCYRVVSVMMKPGTFTSPGSDYTIDITDRYDFDGGQRDTHYDVGRIVLKSSYQPPTAPIQITFEYFMHSAGDYFTVNSYGDYTTDTSNTSNIAYSGIPMYKGTFLRDCFDFRPRISDDGASFSGTGAVSALVPKRGIDLRADYIYYLARKTKIAIDFNGNFFAIDGVPSLNPGDPLDPSMGMVMYSLALEPYTFSTEESSVNITTYDNKRYTMRDIGKLEKRIDNLEYYTSLSLLEQQTESLNVVDGDGLDRFKNGFIVDNFTGHNTGDTNSPDYFCSIDMENGELRPFYSMQNINIVEKNTTDVQRTAANYKLYGDVITLPVSDNPVLVQQPYASRLENVNPFAIFTFLGQMNINPSSDDWFEVNRRPDIVNNIEGNFNTVKTLAEKAGVLGTVWNAWQTQWTGASSVTNQQMSGRYWGSAWGANLGAGTQLSPAEMNARFGMKQGAGWARRELTVQTSATQVGQTRTGTKTTVVAKIDKQIVADRVLSTAAIPYIRSRNILVQTKGLKPNTRFYPFFDNVSVSAYCTPASKLVYTKLAGNFDSETNVGGTSTETARRMNNDTQVCLNRGDVIYVSTRSGTNYTVSSSPATAVVVGTEYNPTTGAYALYVVNVRGTFVASDKLTGNISGATGTFVSLTTNSQGGNLVTSFNGDIALLFNIPNTDAQRFRCGSREFKLVDVNEAEGAFTSRGRATYRAEGVLETRQATFNAVRNGEIVSEQVRENRVVVQTSDRVVSDTGWYDPLAQTFMVQSRGGAFLTEIDIFFATKDGAVPVNLEIREVVNGFPGKMVLPFSRVSLKPENVNLSSTTVSLDGVNVRKYDTPTTFRFPSPVYVQDNTEYAIVLSSDSNNYKVWISQLGDLIPGSTRTITEQPYAGVFFKSQNASTWTADQMQDLKFTIRRAQFATGTVSNVEFVNDVVPYQDLDFDPFETRIGSTKVRVYQDNHGMPTGSKVIISNSDDTKTAGTSGTGTVTCTVSSTSFAGSSTLFTTELEVGSVIYNSAGTYVGVIASITDTDTATLVSNAAVAISNGAYKVTAPINGVPTTEIYKTHTISDVDSDSYCVSVTTNPTSTGYDGGLTVRATHNIQFDALQPSTQIQTFPDTVTTFSVKTVTGASPDSPTQIANAYNPDEDYASVLANETNPLFVPRMIASEINETTSLGGAKSLSFSVAMSTTNDAVSPILDTHRMSMIAISNKVNSPTQDNANVGGLDDNVLFEESADLSIVDNTITTADAAAMEIMRTAVVGKYMTVAGSSSGSSTRLITAVASDGTSITLESDPEAVVGDITLTQHETYLDEISPVDSSTFSKYVTKAISLANASTYLRVRFAASIPGEADVLVYYRTARSGSSVYIDDTNWTLVDYDTPVTKVQTGSSQFIEMTCSTADIPAYDIVQVKLVLQSSNTSAVPRIKDLRVISCA